MDRAPQVPLHISRVPELITPKEMRLGEDACCTAGLRDPARLMDRWPSLRECWRPIRYGILRVGARDGQSCNFNSDGTHSGPGRMSTRGVHASVKPFSAPWLSSRKTRIVFPGGHFAVESFGENG